MHTPANADEIFKGQVRVLVALKGQMELDMKRTLSRAGVEWPKNGRFGNPDTDDLFILGQWREFAHTHHSIGGVHLGMYDELRRRNEEATLMKNGETK